MFGMGTGGSSLLSSPEWYIKRILRIISKFVSLKVSPSNDNGLRSHKIPLDKKFVNTLPQTDNYTAKDVKAVKATRRNHSFSRNLRFVSSSQLSLRSSPRPISIGQLHTLLHFHLRPINLIVYKGSYYLSIWDTLS